ncbi:uncharacterized protein AMSG_05837 [Thecamonas trahens ATCC 50062]|uniref:Uncharacterized protein n=1 Tax=Thecamonas trahens ATCC 50062 TaxID=461836 RepID=A0A0L0DFJ5_THETB|nr:hypothetical protein AMSG_05837 [Thecamonas trahens ATCC 50062]KNC50073.1 hypothetical protein AMSG_05837 [Thecamonas trahens ATCC 50062]|eukprot:XP_013757237.1 hypothetical protein AMSG_05837 [Thecamonas trahens ATCC 50062]
MGAQLSRTTWVGAAFEHRMQAGVGVSLVALFAAIPLGLQLAKSNKRSIAGSAVPQATINAPAAGPWTTGG